MSNKTEQALHGTTSLTFDGDLAAQMVEVLDGYVTDTVARSPERRQTLWNRDYSSHGAYTESLNRIGRGLENRLAALMCVCHLKN